MPIYIYETIPERPGQKKRRYEIWQRMDDAPLNFHPETGEPLRRIIVGGVGMPGSLSDSSSDHSTTDASESDQ